MALAAFVLRSRVRLARAALTTVFCLGWLGCGETYRPVATPIIPTPPSPGFTHLAVVLSGNGTNNPGASTTIDVSGDTAISQATVGLLPSWAFLLSNGKMYVTNSLDDTVSVFSPLTPTPVNTISLPKGSTPVFATTTDTTSVYVANTGNNTVSVLSIDSNVVSNTIPVGVKPVALVELPYGQKVYVANAGSSSIAGSVDSINVIDGSVNPPIAACPAAPWSAPVAIVARSDNARVYVLDQGSGYVTAIDTSSGTTTDTVVGCAPVGQGASFMRYDPALNYLYVTNPVGESLSVLDASGESFSSQSVLGVVSFAAGSAACPRGCSPLSVAVVPPLGSQAYVASAAVSGGAVTSSVAVIETATLALKTTIPLTTVPQSCSAGTPFELYTAASADGTRVYVGNCDAGSTAIIQTSTTSVVTNLPAPLSAAPPSTLSISAATQNGSETTYTYSLVSGPALRIGMTVVVQHMGTSSDNGTFTVTALGQGTFTVVNSLGVTATGQGGIGSALTPQNPVFVVAGS
jgi:YVTN family beta-propeller protein